MKEARGDRAFGDAIAELYERELVPLIFQPYAKDLAERIVALSPVDVLEIAAGTGVLTRALSARLPERARLVASDLNPSMLAQAQRAGTRHVVEWRQADAMQLPFGNASFDVVACQFGAMFFPDRAHAFSGMRRVLRPGGTLLFSVWDDIADNQFAQEVERALAELFPDDPPRFMSRTPHSYHDRARITDDLQRAGFAQAPVFETLVERSRAASAMVPAIAYCQGTPFRNEIESRRAGSLTDVTRAAADRLAHRFGSGVVDGRIQATIVTITA